MSYLDSLVSALSQSISDSMEPFEGDDDTDAMSFGDLGLLGESLDSSILDQKEAPTVQAPAAPQIPASRWMKTYENGRIPLSAMEQIPGGGYLRPDAAAAFMDMYDAAKADGVTLSVGAGGGAYRTYQQQWSAYYYPTNNLPHAVPGTSNHGWGIAVDMTANEWLLKNAAKYGWHRPLSNDPPHWEYTGSYTGTRYTEDYTPPRTRERGKEDSEQPRDVMLAMTPEPSTPSSNLFVNGMFALMSDEAAKDRYGSVPAYVTKGDNGQYGSIKRQLWQGFMDAGRPDLARMVYTKDFQQWVAAESGWDVNNVSKYYPGHGRNAGLFQFALLDRNWVWGDVNQSSWTYGASAYEQAQLAVKYFGKSLTPAAIKQYAEQVRNGTYHGWP